MTVHDQLERHEPARQWDHAEQRHTHELWRHPLPCRCIAPIELELEREDSLYVVKLDSFTARLFHTSAPAVLRFQEDRAAKAASPAHTVTRKRRRAHNRLWLRREEETAETAYIELTLCVHAARCRRKVEAPQGRLAISREPRKIPL